MVSNHGFVRFASALITILAAATVSLPAAPADEQAIAHIGDPKNPAALPNELAQAYKAGARVIVINPGVYQLPATGGKPTFNLDHWSNVTILAPDVTLVMHAMNSGRERNSGNCFTFFYCQNVTLDGPTITQDQMTYYQGQVVKVVNTSDGFDCDWKSDAGYPDPNAVFSQQTRATDGYADYDEAASVPLSPIRMRVFWIIDKNTRRVKLGVCGPLKPASPPQSNPDGTIHLTFRISPNRPNCFNTLFRKPRPGVTVGDFIVSRYSEAHYKIALVRSRDCTIQNVTLMRNGFSPIYEFSGGGNRLLYCRWTQGPKPEGATAEPLVTNESDGFHSTNAAPGPDLEHCVMEGVFLDDCIAIHGEYQKVLAVSGQTLTLEDKQFQYAALEAGQPIQICDEHGFYATALVNSFQVNKDQTDTLTLDRPVSVPVGAWVTNPNRCGRGFKIIDCTLGNTVNRGLELKSSDGVILGNTIRNCGSAAISMGPEVNLGHLSSGKWAEAGYLDNVIIEDNTLENSGMFGDNNGDKGAAVFVHGAYYTAEQGGPGSVGNSRIIVKNNTFVSNFRGDVFVQWTRSGYIGHNVMTGPTWSDTTGDRRASSIRILNSNPIQVESNQVTNPDAYAPNSIAPPASQP